MTAGCDPAGRGSTPLAHLVVREVANFCYSTTTVIRMPGACSAQTRWYIPGRLNRWVNRLSLRARVANRSGPDRTLTAWDWRDCHDHVTGSPTPIRMVGRSVPEKKALSVTATSPGCSFGRVGATTAAVAEGPAAFAFASTSARA